MAPHTHRTACVSSVTRAFSDSAACYRNSHIILCSVQAFMITQNTTGMLGCSNWSYADPACTCVHTQLCLPAPVCAERMYSYSSGMRAGGRWRTLGIIRSLPPLRPVWYIELMPNVQLSHFPVVGQTESRRLSMSYSRPGFNGPVLCTASQLLLCGPRAPYDQERVRTLAASAHDGNPR